MPRVSPERTLSPGLRPTLPTDHGLLFHTITGLECVPRPQCTVSPNPHILWSQLPDRQEAFRDPPPQRSLLPPPAHSPPPRLRHQMGTLNPHRVLLVSSLVASEGTLHSVPNQTGGRDAPPQLLGRKATDRMRRLCRIPNVHAQVRKGLFENRHIAKEEKTLQIRLSHVPGYRSRINR